MIETQDTLVGQISNNVNDVEANTQQANTELRHAITSAKSARRKKWCLICTLFIVLLGLATYLAIHFLVINPPSKENSTAAKSTADTSIARESVLTASSVDNDTDATFYRVG